MVQTDSKGKVTGNTVDKVTYEYQRARAEAYKAGTKDYMLWLLKNHDITVNKESKQANVDFWVNYYKENPREPFEGWKGTKEEYNEYLLKKAIEDASPEAYIALLKKLKSSGKLTAEEYKKAEFYNSRYMHLLNVNPHSEFLDPKYTKIMSLHESDPKRKFYEHFVKTIKEGREQSGINDDIYLAKNYIPDVHKTLPAVKQMFTDYWESWFDTIEQDVFSNIDPITGEIVPTIPMVTMTGRMSAEDKSYELDEVLERFIDDKNNKILKEEIQDEVRLLLNVLEDQNYFDTSTSGTVLKENHDGVVTPRSVKKGKEANSYKMADYIIKSHLYGMYQGKGHVIASFHDKDTKARIKELEKLTNPTEEEVKELADLRQFKNRVVTTKTVANNLINFTVKKALGLNPISGVTELIQGLSAIAVEAAGGIHFNMDNYMRGLRMIIASNNPTVDRTKISTLMDIFDITGEIDQTQDKNSWINKSLFVFLRMANHTARGTAMLAMLDGQTITDKSGKKHKMLDVVDVVDGRIVLTVDAVEEDQITNIVDGKPQYTQKFIDLRNKLQYVIKSSISRESAQDPIRVNATVVGRILGQFRQSWMFEGIHRRFGSEKDNILLGQKTKGYYKSVFWDANGKVDFQRAARLIWKGAFNKEGLKAEGIESLDEANLRKFLMEMKFISFFTAVALGFMALLKAGDDERDWIDYMSVYLINQSFRVNRDLTFYFNPNSATDLFKYPAPIVNTILELQDLVTAIARMSWGDFYIYEGTKKEELRVLRSVENLSIGIRQARLVKKKFTDY
jgi:hypothetical protein